MSCGQAERKLGTSTREPDSDNADVGKIIDNARGRLPNFGGFPFCCGGGVSLDKTKKLTLAACLTAAAVVGSVLSFPVLGSRCAPVQHMVNVFCAVLLGWRYGVGSAFAASLLRNLFGLGSVLAFPGSMCGAFLSGVVYARTKNIWLTVLAEAFGTGIIGGLAAYPTAILFMGKVAGDVAFYVYVVPFLISTICGAFLAGLVVKRFKFSG